MKNKRSSAPDLPSLQADKFYYQEPEFSQSTPSLISNQDYYESAYRRPEEIDDPTKDSFGYSGPPPVNLPALNNKFPPLGQTYAPYSYYQQSNTMQYYGMMVSNPSGSVWPAATQEHSADPTCACAFCVTLPTVSASPHPDALPMLETQPIGEMHQQQLTLPVYYAPETDVVLNRNFMPSVVDYHEEAKEE
jgi:hypothetical protein